MLNGTDAFSALGEIKPTPTEPAKPERQAEKDNTTCECGAAQSEGSKIDAAEAEQFIEFENVLQNVIYVK